MNSDMNAWQAMRGFGIGGTAKVRQTYCSISHVQRECEYFGEIVYHILFKGIKYVDYVFKIKR